MMNFAWPKWLRLTFSIGLALAALFTLMVAGTAVMQPLPMLWRTVSAFNLTVG